MHRRHDKGATLCNVKERQDLPSAPCSDAKTPVHPGRIASLSGFGRACAVEFADELAEVVATLEAAFPSEDEPQGTAELPHTAHLSELRDDREIMRPGSARWLTVAPDRDGDWFRVPRVWAGDKAGGGTFDEVTDQEEHGHPTAPPLPESASCLPFPSAQVGDATDLLEELQSGRRSATSHIDNVLARAADDPFVALIELHGSEARERAEALDKSLSAGDDPLPLHGLPVAIKANLCVEDRLATSASASLANYTAPYTATVVRRLIAAGAIPIATANMDEFAMGSSGEHSAHGATINPWSPVIHGELAALAPGGSSSGTAAAVAGDLAALALGSDAGGSVRQPAAFCGVTGLRPTQGRLSRFGLIAFASSFDVIGPVARSARDLEALFPLVAGLDPRDPTTVKAPEEAQRLPRIESLQHLNIGVPRRLLDELGDSLEPGVAASFEQSLEELKAAGARLFDIELKNASAALSAYHVISCSEAASNLSRIDGVRFGMRVEAPGSADNDLVAMIRATRESGFGTEVCRRILIGTLALSRDGSRALYGRARATRDAITSDFLRIFNTAHLCDGGTSADVIALPTSPTVAFGLGARTADPVAMYRADLLTVPASLAGLPAVSLPGPLAQSTCNGRTVQLPAGLQLVGPRGMDERLLRIASLYQQETRYHMVRPPRITSASQAGGLS